MIARILIFAACFLLILGGAAYGAEWTSPDGVIQVTEPEASQLKRMENPPDPFLVVWLSADETLRLGVMQTTIPTSQIIDRTKVDESFAKEFHGSITTATTSASNGHEIWITTVGGDDAGAKVSATQAIVRVNDTVYKAMVMSVGDGTKDEAAIQTFLQSIQITGPPHPGGIAGGTVEGGSVDASLTSDEKLQNVSYLIGRAVGMVLMILLVLWVVGLLSRKKRQPIPPPMYHPGQYPPGSNPPGQFPPGPYPPGSPPPGSPPPGSPPSAPPR